MVCSITRKRVANLCKSRKADTGAKESGEDEDDSTRADCDPEATTCVGEETMGDKEASANPGTNGERIAEGEPLAQT